MNKNFSLCVYCGARSGKRQEYLQAAQSVGRWIGINGGQLVYGGGRTGMMGAIASAAREAGARVVGIIPRSLVEREVANHFCDELCIVEDMHERKAAMSERSDAFLALPGGIGTLEELFEMWTWHQLGYHNKPIGILNVGGYYDDLLRFLHSSVQEDFMRPYNLDLVNIDNEVDSLLKTLIGL